MVVIRLTADQSSNLTFPIGCPVWYNFPGKKDEMGSLKRGVVKSVSLRDSQLYYEVTYCDGDENITITEEVNETKLGFGALCPVTIISDNKSGTADDTSEGEIVMCTTDANNKVVYTAMIFMDGSQVKYESEIDAARVKYRKVKVNDMESNEEHAGNTNAISTSTKQTTDCKEDKVDKMNATQHPQQPPTQRYVPSSITCSDSVSKRSFADSNDGGGDSSRKRARYPTGAKLEVDGGYDAPAIASNSHDATNVKLLSHPKFPNVSKLEITPPLWLQKDRPSQRSLFFHLIGKHRERSENIIKRINQESQCRVHVDMKNDVFVPIKINVEPLNVSTAQQDLFRARQMLQDLFLEYVGNDGCRGRLVCEIAQSCWGAHRPSLSTSNAVKDINPLLDNRMVRYMSIVELSYEEHTREFHAAHILHKPLLREITGLGCDLILVAKGFRISTNACDPYVFVYGRQYQDVDKAVQLVKKKIKQHQHVCGKCVLG